MLPLASGGIEIIVFASVLSLLGTLAVGLRLWARRLIGVRLNASDFLILTSLLLAIALSLVLIVGVIVGHAGYHESQLNESSTTGSPSLDKATELIFIVDVLWLISNCLTKLSILAFYLHLFGSSRLRHFIYLVMTLVTMLLIADFIVRIFSCWPVSRNWTFGDTNFCGFSVVEEVVKGLAVTVLDVVIIALPMPLIFRLQMPLARKLSVAAILSLGLAVTVISGLRLWSLTKVRLSDATYTTVLLGIFTVLESHLGIVAASLPMLQPVLAALGRSTMFRLVSDRSRRKAQHFESTPEDSRNTQLIRS